MEIGELITVFRKQAGMTIDDLASQSRVPKGTINKIIGGVTKAPTLENIKAIAKALGKTLADFDEHITASGDITPTEYECIKKYRELDAHGKDLIDTILTKEYDRIINERAAAEEEDTEKVYLNYYNLPVSAGKGVYLDGDSYDILELPKTAQTSKANFALKVRGDSMEPDYSDGDIILVKTQPSVNNGELGIFVVNGEGYFKKIKGNRLISLNPDYEDRILTEADEFCCMGKVIGRLEE